MKVSDIEVEFIDSMGNDLSVVNAARVSFDKESSLDFSTSGDMDLGSLRKEDAKLIAYLAKHKHFSPFNHSFITVRVKAPIFVARQLVKHKFMPWNEVSRRYVDSEPEFYIPEGWRAKAENIKQGSSGVEVSTIQHRDPVTGEKWISFTENSVLLSTEALLSLYEDMLAGGICPEQARMVLPLNTMTEWMWSGTLGAFCDMLRLRLDPHTQEESRIVANKIFEIIKPLFPVSVEALLGEQNA